MAKIILFFKFAKKYFMYLKNFFNKLSDKNILVIGDVMLDTYLFGKVDRISPEAPVPVVSVLNRDNRLGGAANVAINIKSLGANPILCSVIGKDEKANVFLSQMKANELSSEGIVCDDSRPTTTKFRIIGNNMQMLRVDEETTSPLDNKIINLLISKIDNIINEKTISCIVFQDYDKGCIGEKLIAEVVKIANNRNIPIAVDPKKNNFFNYKNVCLFKPNLKEFREGHKIDKPLSIEELISLMNDFQEKQNIKNMMVTMSEKGILLSQMLEDKKFKYVHKEAYLRHIADVSGAGDTVIAVASACLASGLDNETTITLSNLAGGLVCQYVGVVPINKNEFISEIKRLDIS